MGTKQNKNTIQGVKLPIDRRNFWLSIGLLVLIPFIIYWPSIHAPFILDDIPKISENPDIRSLEKIRTKLIYTYNERAHTFVGNDPSRPIVYLTYILNYHFGELDTFGYHVVNVLLHTINGLLVFFFVYRFLKFLPEEHAALIPLTTALFFVCSPINAHVASYIYSRSDALATLFFLLSLLSFMFVINGNARWIVLSLTCFVLSLFSKQIAITLPAILLMFDYFIVSKRNLDKLSKNKYYHAPFWFLALAYMLFRFFYFGALGDLEAQDTLNRYSYFISSPYIILSYIRMMISPSGLCLDHLVIPSDTLLNFRVLIPVVFLMTGILSLFLWVRKSDSQLSKISIFALGWFLVILSPTSSIFPTTQLLVENRAYLSGITIYLMLAVMYSLMLRHWARTDKIKKMLILCVLCAHIGFLCFMTVRRNKLFSNPRMLWEEATSQYPSNARAYNNLGLLYARQGMNDTARQVYQKAIQVNPSYVNAYYNIGLSYFSQNQPQLAVPYFQKAISLDPNYTKAHNNLGNIYYAQGQYSEAREHFLNAIKSDPFYADGYNNVASSYYQQDRYEEALEYYQKTINLDPNYIDAYKSIGLIWFKQKNYIKSLEIFEKAQQLFPGDLSISKTVEQLKNLTRK